MKSDMALHCDKGLQCHVLQISILGSPGFMYTDGWTIWWNLRVGFWRYLEKGMWMDELHITYIKLQADKKDLYMDIHRNNSEHTVISQTCTYKNWRALKIYCK
jgi:hypothetical protein